MGRASFPSQDLLLYNSMIVRLFSLALVIAVGFKCAPSPAQVPAPVPRAQVDEKWAESQIEKISTRLRFEGTKGLSVERHFQAGLLSHSRGDYPRALEHFERVAELAPESAAAHLNLGIVLGDMGRFDDALAEFDEAIRIEPDNAAAYFNRGMIYMKQGKYRDAVASMEKSLEVGGDSLLLHYNLAVCYEYMGGARYGPGFDKDKSVFHYKKALEKKPGSAVIHFNIAMVHMHAGDRGAAEAELSEAIRLDPSMADAFLQMGILMLERENYHSALRNLREAERLDPGLPAEGWLIEAHAGLGQFYLDNGDYEEAKKNFREVLQLDPTRVNELVLLARACRGRGEYSEAIRCYDDALAMDEDLPLSEEIAETYFLWGDGLLSEGHPGLAAAKYEIGLAEKPGDGRAWARLGAIYHRHLGEKGKAIHAYRKSLSAPIPPVNPDRIKREMARVIREGDTLIDEYRALVLRNPDNPTLHYNLAVFFHQRGDLDGAIAEYTKALHLDPGNTLAHYNLGLAYRRRGKGNAALREFKTAIQLKPDYWRAHYALGRLYEDAGEKRRACAAYRRAIEIEPGFAAGHLALGLALEELGQKEEAREHLKNYMGLSGEKALAPAGGSKGGQPEVSRR